MKQLIGAAILGQSGGPTSVINSSAAGVFIEALNQDCITNVFGAKHGIKGILNEEFYDISKEDINELKLLRTTPSSDIGSVRYKLKNLCDDDTDYKRLLEVFKKYNIRYFFYKEEMILWIHAIKYLNSSKILDMIVFAWEFLKQLIMI